MYDKNFKSLKKDSEETSENGKITDALGQV